MKTSAFILSMSLLVGRLQAAEIPEEARQCYEWFSTLGFPEVKDAKWAEVWSGSWFKRGGDTQPQTRTSHGFVVQDQNGSFSILAADLTIRELKKSSPDKPAHERIAFEERPFLSMVREQLQTLQNPPKDGFRRFGAHLGHKAEVFALSYFCWRRGESDLAAKLYAEAKKLENRVSSWQEGKVVPDMREALEIELGHAAMWDAVLRMGGGSLAGGSWGGRGPLQPRAEVLEAFRRIVRLFPRCEHIERAKATIAMLERMVAEEAKHPVLTQQQIDQLPLEKRIAELIWRLRDQNGQQMSQPGWCSVLGYGDGESAGHQLVKIGYPAAPALIEALTDDRFSRSVGFHRNFHFSHTILTIGDCAQQILQEISGQGFYSPDSTSGYMSNEDKMLAVQKAARVWWDGYQKKGLKQMLVDDISSGQKSPHSLVEQLKKEDASAVEAAVLAGAAKAAADEWMARQFIDQLDALKSPQSITALAKIMKEHPKLEVRLDAAARLLNHDHPDTLNTLLHDWSAYPPAKEDHDEAFEAITDILACQGGDQAVQALASGWDARAARQRLIIVQQIGSCMAAKPRDHSFDSHARPRKPSPQAKERAVELLVHALEDTETSYGMTGGGSDLTLGEASIGDFALQALHQLDAAKYTFSPKAARRLRDTERITMANLWRKEHGQPLLPLPPPPGPKLPPAEALKIVRVSLEPADAPAADGITKKAQSLQGRSFAPETIPQLLLWFAQANLPGVRGLDIEASRENDLTGVEVYLRVHLGQPKNDDSPDWQIRHGGRAGEKQLGSSSGSSSHSNVVKPDKWEDFEEVVREALKQPPQTEFRFHAGLRRE